MIEIKHCSNGVMGKVTFNKKNDLLFYCSNVLMITMIIKIMNVKCNLSMIKIFLVRCFIHS